MKYTLYCFSANGKALTEKISGLLEGDVTVRFKDHSLLAEDFHKSDALIFISATGIAVRLIAPYLESKTTDPAVLVTDDQGRFIIPLLSGHIGGANALASEIAEKLDATPVITTATDGAGRFSCDTWAVTHNCEISDLKAAKAVSAEILNRDIPVISEFGLPRCLPAGLKATIMDSLTAEDSEGPGIYIGIRKEKQFKTTLNLIPKIITLGIGCRKETTQAQILLLIGKTLSERNIDIRAVKQIVSIDLKKDEKGLLDAAAELDVPVLFYSAEELQSVPGDFHESQFVEETTGVGNVCERAAMYTNKDKSTPKKELLIEKTAENGVTLAAAIDDWRPDFS